MKSSIIKLSKDRRLLELILAHTPHTTEAFSKSPFDC